MKSSALEVDGLAHWLRSKPERRTRAFFESIGKPQDGPSGEHDWELARKLHYKGLVKPVKQSEAWIPCVVTEVGERVITALHRMDEADKKKAEVKK